MKASITLKSETFNYPTKEERNKISKLIPKINRLKLVYKSATIEILKDSDFDNAVKDEDSYWWSNCFNNRLGLLTETYVYVKTHFIRLKESTLLDSENKHTDEILLNYYIEIFYYYFFSARDVLGQFLNIIGDLKIEEHKIFLNEIFVEKIKSTKIKNLLSIFLNNTKDSYNIRNTFNHRFTPTHKDNRAKRNIFKDEKNISFYEATEIDIKMFIDDIDNLMKNLGYLMNELSEEIK